MQKRPIACPYLPTVLSVNPKVYIQLKKQNSKESTRYELPISFLTSSRSIFWCVFIILSIDSMICRSLERIPAVCLQSRPINPRLPTPQETTVNNSRRCHHSWHTPPAYLTAYLSWHLSPADPVQTFQTITKNRQRSFWRIWAGASHPHPGHLSTLPIAKCFTSSWGMGSGKLLMYNVACIDRHADFSNIVFLKH